MRRAKRGARKHDRRSDRAEESSWKPLNQDQTLTPQLDSTTSPPPTSSQPENLESISNSGPRISKHGRNPKWVSRKRPGRGVKPRFLDKSEVGSLDSEVGSLSIDERVDGQVEIVEKNEIEGGEYGSGSKIEVLVESSKEESNDVMDILEELRLSSEEPELSEEQLRNNCQSQEDEVIDL